VEELQNEIKRELRFLAPNHNNKPASKTVVSKRPTRQIATPSKKRSPLAKGKP
jgi:hypothetical protein